MTTCKRCEHSIPDGELYYRINGHDFCGDCVTVRKPQVEWPDESQHFADGSSYDPVTETISNPPPINLSPRAERLLAAIAEFLPRKPK